MVDLALDLFGEPLLPARGPGRPSHVATPGRRDLVHQLRAKGLSQPAIADALGITVPTLVLHYPNELNSTSQAWRRHAAGERKDDLMDGKSHSTTGPAWKAQAHDPLPTGSHQMQGGAGRLARMRSALEVLSMADRRELLDALDELMRPMTAREIEHALAATALSKTERAVVAGALKKHPILMIAY